MAEDLVELADAAEEARRKKRKKVSDQFIDATAESSLPGAKSARKLATRSAEEMEKMGI